MDKYDSRPIHTSRHDAPAKFFSRFPAHTKSLYPFIAPIQQYQKPRPFRSGDLGVLGSGPVVPVLAHLRWALIRTSGALPIRNKGRSRGGEFNAPTHQRSRPQPLARTAPYGYSWGFLGFTALLRYLRWETPDTLATPTAMTGINRFVVLPL